MHDDGPEDVHGERWTAFVGGLREDAAAMVMAFVERVQAIPPYGRGVVPMDRLVTDATLPFDVLLRRLGGRPLPDRMRSIAPSIGRDRARRGVPLDDLLTAVRLDFRVLWSALRDRAGPADEALLVARASGVWNVVEEYSTQIQVSYQAEAALLARELLGERTMLVAALLDNQAPSRSEVARVAVALDVDVDADLL